MIVVVGRPGLRGGAGDGAQRLDRLPALIASAVAAASVRVELVGSVGDDPAGDRLAVLLGDAGVGHAALLRDPAAATPVADGGGDGGAAPLLPRLDAADLELGLRYLPECRVLVVAEPLDGETLDAAMAGAGFHDAALIVLVAAGAAPPPGLPADATVLALPDEAPADPALPDDPEPRPNEGAFADLVAAYAVALDGGRAPADAFRRARASVGWEPAGAG